MPVTDDNVLLEVVAQELNGGLLNTSHKSWHKREKAASVIDAIEAAGFVIRRADPA